MMADDPVEYAAAENSEVARPKRFLPTMKSLATAALVAVAVPVGVTLVMGAVKIGLSLLAGYGLCLCLYAFLMHFVEHGMNVIASGVRGTKSAGPDGFAKLSFWGMALGKFFVIALLMFVLIDVVHAHLGGLLAGFLVSQVAISIVTVKSLARTTQG